MSTKALAVGKEAANGKSNASTKTVAPKKEATPSTKKETKVVPLKTSEPVGFSLLERIERVKLLDGLTNKRAKVVETLTDLRKFQFSSDDSCELEITDSSGKDFRTGNSNLIGMLTEHLENLLQDKVKELDEQILDFEI